MADNSYLGTAWQYPISIANGSLQIVSSPELIQQSIRQILSTPVGSRLFLREYGSRLREILFEPNDDILDSLIHYFVDEALSAWEKRIKLLNVNSYRDVENEVYCEITYRILQTNEVDSFVLNFYKELKY